VTGARLLQMCRTESPYCTGYVAGVADALASCYFRRSRRRNKNAAGWS